MDSIAPNEYSKSLVSQLRDRRKSLFYSQEYMAVKLGCTQKGYSKIELGKVKLTLDTFLTMCDVLDLSPDSLMTSASEQ